MNKHSEYQNAIECFNIVNQGVKDANRNSILIFISTTISFIIFFQWYGVAYTFYVVFGISSFITFIAYSLNLLYILALWAIAYHRRSNKET